MTKPKFSRFVIFVFIAALGVTLFIGLVPKIAPDFAAKIGLSSPVKANDEPEKETALPKLELSLNNLSIDELRESSKETKYSENTLKIAFENNTIKNFTNVEVKTRGNSTYNLSKFPLQIKFSEKVDLFNFGKSRKYILLANYFDYSNLRNDLALYLSRKLGVTYALQGQFVELSINGEYRGLYYLTPKVEIAKSRVNLTEPLGVLAEFDNLNYINETCHYSSLGACITIKDVVTSDLEAEATEDFMLAFKDFEGALKSGDYEKMGTLLDLDDLVRYYLLSELTVNPDSYSSSFYFYKDGPDDIIHVGPAWDFDFALGNKRWTWGDVANAFNNPERFRIPSLCENGRISELGCPKQEEETISATLNLMIYYLSRIPEFNAAVRSAYKSLLFNQKSEILAYLDETARKIRPAALRDVSAREIIKSDNPAESYDGDSVRVDVEIEYLRDWLSRRLDYLDWYFSAQTFPSWSQSIEL